MDGVLVAPASKACAHDVDGSGGGTPASIIESRLEAEIAVFTSNCLSPSSAPPTRRIRLRAASGAEDPLVASALGSGRAEIRTPPPLYEVDDVLAESGAAALGTWRGERGSPPNSSLSPLGRRAVCYAAREQSPLRGAPATFRRAAVRESRLCWDCAEVQLRLSSLAALSSPHAPAQEDASTLPPPPPVWQPPAWHEPPSWQPHSPAGRRTVGSSPLRPQSRPP